MLSLPLVLFMLTASLAGDAQAGPAERPLRFCLAAHNLPFSTSHPPWGIDGELAQKLGAKLNREAIFVWISEEEESPEAALTEGRCDMAMGAIVEAGGMAQRSTVPGLALTSPYYTAGYMLIHQPSRSSPSKLEELSGQRVAVEMVSIPIYTLKQRGHSVYAVDDSEAVVKAVAESRVPYGYVWGPVGAWLIRDRDDVRLSTSFDPVERWSFAIATRAADQQLRKRIDEALRELVSTGEVQRIFARYDVPYLKP